MSCVLTAFIIWPLFLAWLLPPWTYWFDSWTMLRYVIIIALTALTTTALAMFCSVIFSKTSVSLMTTYMVLLLLYAAPVAAWIFAQWFSPGMDKSLVDGSIVTSWSNPQTWLHISTSASPMSAAFSLPLTCGDTHNQTPGAGLWWKDAGTAYIAFYLLLDAFLLARCCGSFIAAGGCGRRNDICRGAQAAARKTLFPFQLTRAAAAASSRRGPMAARAAFNPRLMWVRFPPPCLRRRRLTCLVVGRQQQCQKYIPPAEPTSPVRARHSQSH